MAVPDEERKKCGQYECQRKKRFRGVGSFKLKTPKIEWDHKIKVSKKQSIIKWKQSQLGVRKICCDLVVIGDGLAFSCPPRCLLLVAILLRTPTTNIYCFRSPQVFLILPFQETYKRGWKRRIMQTTVVFFEKQSRVDSPKLFSMSTINSWL